MFSILIITVSLFYTQSEHICEENPPGQYCTENLSGYHDCIVNENGDVTTSGIITCQDQTRCSCFLKNKCTVLTDEICQPYIEANFVENFWTTGYGSTVVNSPTGRTVRPVSVEIIQNRESGHLKKYIWDGPNEEFLYILKDGEHFNQFKGGVSGGIVTCTKKILDEFPAFGNDLKKFTQLSSNGVREEWFFQTGRRNQGENLIKETWVTEKITNPEGEEKLKPMSYRNEFLGGNAARFTSVTNWKFGLFFNLKFNQDYFRPHPSCGIL